MCVRACLHMHSCAPLDDGADGVSEGQEIMLGIEQETTLKELEIHLKPGAFFPGAGRVVLGLGSKPLSSAAF